MPSMSRATPLTVLLVQLPIPPLGPGPDSRQRPPCRRVPEAVRRAEGTWRRSTPSTSCPAAQANTLGDHALVAALAEREPVAGRLHLLPLEHRAHPLGRPRAEAAAARTSASSWAARRSPPTTPGCWTRADYDFAVIGEGEQTFAQLLLGLLDDDAPAGRHRRPLRAAADAGLATTRLASRPSATPLPGPEPARLAVPGRHPRRRRRADAAAGDDPAAAVFKLQVLLLPQVLRQASITSRTRTSGPACGTPPSAASARSSCSTRR